MSLAQEEPDIHIGANLVNSLLRLPGGYRKSAELRELLAKYGIPVVSRTVQGDLQWSQSVIQAKRDKILQDLAGPTAPAAPAAAPGPDLLELLRAELPELVAKALSLNVCQALDASIEDALLKPTETLKTILSGNQAIFREAEAIRKDLEAMRSDLRQFVANETTLVRQDISALAGEVGHLQARIAALGKASAPAAPTAPTPPAEVPAPATKPQPRPALLPAGEKRKKVGIVGLFPPTSSDIEREYGDVLKLTILEPNETNKLVQLKHYDHVFLLSRYTSSNHQSILKNHGQKPKVLASVGELRDALTRVFVEA